MTGVKRSTWAASLRRTRSTLEKYNYSRHPSLARIHKFHDQLICAGLQNGWIALDKKEA